MPRPVQPQPQTYRFEIRTPGGSWQVADRRVSAIEADYYRQRLAADPDFRIIPETPTNPLQSKTP